MKEFLYQVHRLSLFVFVYPSLLIIDVRPVLPELSFPLRIACFPPPPCWSVYFGTVKHYMFFYFTSLEAEPVLIISPLFDSYQPAVSSSFICLKSGVVCCDLSPCLCHPSLVAFSYFLSLSFPVIFDPLLDFPFCNSQPPSRSFQSLLHHFICFFISLDPYVRLNPSHCYCSFF